MASRSTGKVSKGKRNRKFGRNARKPSQIRYNSVQRWESNARRHVDRDNRRIARNAKKTKQQKVA